MGTMKINGSVSHPDYCRFPIIILFVLQQGKLQWVLSTIYASPHASSRNSLWQYVKDMAKFIFVP